MELFQPILPPDRQKTLPINDHGLWFTWSSDFRSFVKSEKHIFTSFGIPSLIDIDGKKSWLWHRPGNPYRKSFTVDLYKADLDGFQHHIESFSKSFANLAIGNRIMLLSGLIDDDISGHVLSVIFACFRDALVSVSKDNANALYTPLGRSGKYAGEFRLHADLYGPSMLFNAFENVPSDDSGCSTFLSVSEFRKILNDIASLPLHSRERIIDLLETESKTDGFSEFYQLLYGLRNKWSSDLELAMKNRQLKIKMNPGQGYIINDRKWLHGRGQPTGGVSARRLHRLVFTNTVTA